jgi:transposase
MKPKQSMPFKLNPIVVPEAARRSDVYLAIDLHAHHSVLGAVDAKGIRLGDARFPTSERDLVHHVSSIKARRKHLVIEESPMTHWAMGLLRPHVTTILSCDPKENRLISSNARKSDEIDVYLLCKLRRLDGLKEVYHTSDDGRFAFRALIQSYNGLQRDQVRAKNKLKATYRRLGIVARGARVYSADERYGFLQQVKDPLWRCSLERVYRLYDATRQEILDATKQIRSVSRRYPEIAQFRKIPGVGLIVGATFSAYIQTPHRFSTKSRLYRYCQLSITDRSSDGKPLGYQRLDRGAGCAQLKSASYHAWLAATNSVRGNEVKDCYEAALEQTGDPVHARLTTQRKILAVMLSLWKHNACYDPDEFIRMPLQAE